MTPVILALIALCLALVAFIVTRKDSVEPEAEPAVEEAPQVEHKTPVATKPIPTFNEQTEEIPVYDLASPDVAGGAAPRRLESEKLRMHKEEEAAAPAPKVETAPEVASLTAVIEGLRHELATEGWRADDAAKQVAGQTKEMEQKTLELENVTNTVRSQKEKVEALRRTVKDKEAEASAARVAAGDMEQELIKAKASHASDAAEVSAQREREAEREEKLQRMGATIQMQEGRLTEMIYSMEELQASKSSAVAEQERLINRMQAEMQDKASLETAYAQAQSMCGNMERDCGQLSNRLIVAEQSYAEISRELHQTRSQLQGQINSMALDYQGMESALAVGNQEANAVREALEATVQERDAAAEATEAVRTELAEKKAEIAEMHESKAAGAAESATETESLRTQLAEAVAAAADAATLAASAASAAEKEAEQAMATVVEAKEAVFAEKEALEATLAAAATKTEEKEARIAKLEAALAAKEQAITAGQEQVQELSQKISELQTPTAVRPNPVQTEEEKEGTTLATEEHESEPSEESEEFNMPQSE